MRLRIVSVNDVYALDWLPRLRTLVRQQAEQDPADRLLVVMAGDFLAPSILSSLDGGRGMVDCLTSVGLTHAILGNHEDDLPLAQLRARLHELPAVVLGTNLPDFDPPLRAHEVIELGDPPVRVGLLGVVMRDPGAYRRPPFGGATLLPANDAALAEAEHLRRAGCGLVVAITHQTQDDDRALARLLPGPALILGGHEHTPLLEQVQGTWVCKAGTEATHAIVVDVTLAPGQPPDIRVRLEDTAPYAEDPDVRQRVDRHLAVVLEIEGATLLALEPGAELSSVGTRRQQTTLGTLVCNRVRDALGAEACLFNGGGIRGNRSYRERFGYGDLKTEVPFDNEMVVVPLPGAVLDEAVAASRMRAPAESGGFLQVDDGMVVDSRSHWVTAVAGAPLERDRVYRVAMVRDILAGMDRNEPLLRFAQHHVDLIPPAGSGRGVAVILTESFARELWKRVGAGADVDHDGVVTRHELKEAVLRATATSAEVLTDVVMTALDRNDDATISGSENPDNPDQANRNAT